MSKTILRYSLLSLVFLFSLAPVAGAQILCQGCFTPTGVVFAYQCELDCLNCPSGEPGCKACDSLELAFGGEFATNRCLPPCGPIEDCEQGPVQ